MGTIIGSPWKLTDRGCLLDGRAEMKLAIPRTRQTFMMGCVVQTLISQISQASIRCASGRCAHAAAAAIQPPKGFEPSTEWQDLLDLRIPKFTITYKWFIPIRKVTLVLLRYWSQKDLESTAMSASLNLHSPLQAQPQATLLSSCRPQCDHV